MLTEPELRVTGVPVGRADRQPLQLSMTPVADATPARAGLISTQTWQWGLMAVDVAVAQGGVALASALRFGTSATLTPSVPYLALIIAVPPLWLGMLLTRGVYERRCIGAGGTEFGRIVNAGLWTLAVVVFGSYLSHADLSRQVVALTIPIITAGTLGAHLAARKLLHRRIRSGAALHRVVLAGSVVEVRGLAEHLGRLPHTGLIVVGVCVPGRHSTRSPIGAVPVIGTAQDVVAAARRVGADTIAIAGSTLLSGAHLRRLSWDLEGSGIRLLIASGATELAGRRLLVQPIGGLPLLQVKEAAFSGPPRIIKATIDRVGAALMLAALGPVLGVIALAVATTSSGGPLFRQTRIGLHGQPFTMLKFRTMYKDADRDAACLSRADAPDGVLFKLRRDPRVTSVGRHLRRFSLDELPQLWNVLTGSMSLVGPRPPLASEVERYPDDLRRRRLLVKPGITGLWQVSGRSDLAWDETVRLDLHYVENWSVALDVMVMVKTLRAVLSGRGAY